MPPTYSQLIELALTNAAKGGREWFSLTWLRQQIRSQARKDKKRLGPHLNRFILRTLANESQMGYLHLQRGPRTSVVSIYMSAGGRHEYTHRTTPVTIEAQPSSAESINDLRNEVNEMKSELLKMEIQLARADSVIDEENGDVGVVTGAPSAVIERTRRLIVLSKNRKQQISDMWEDEEYRRNEALLNDHVEFYARKQEQEDREVLIKGELDTEEGQLMKSEQGNHEE